MSSPPPEAAHLDTPATPVTSGERVILLDVLRGFALGGVFVSNAYMHMSGLGFLPPDTLKALRASWVDSAANVLYFQLLSGKAMAIFSFLFGLGFAIQMSRTEERGAAIVPVYVRRMGVLLLLGLAHALALWYGDILSHYALTGLALLLFRKTSDRKLLIWGAVLMLAAPVVVSALLRYGPLLLNSQESLQAAAKETASKAAELRARTLEGFTSGSFFTSVRTNVDYYLHGWLRPMMLSYALIVLGRFFLGLLAGRRRLFHDVEQHAPLFRRLLGWGLLAGVVGNGAVALLSYLVRNEVLPKKGPWLLLQPSLWEVGTLGLATFYVAGLALLFQLPRARRVLSLLAPAGQMALTNYLSQSVISQLVFYGYGLGLMGKLGAASCLALMSGLFCVQVLLSHLWLAHFRFGPAEWLWRSLTYWRLQPMRRASGEGALQATSAP